MTNQVYSRVGDSDTSVMGIKGRWRQQLINVLALLPTNQLLIFTKTPPPQSNSAHPSSSQPTRDCVAPPCRGSPAPETRCGSRCRL
ncbi:hypothetical protein STEG23_011451 [Scotinomys teguina]